MPDEMFEYAEQARGRGLRAIIAGAGGAAHLPGMLAAKTIVPVLGVPVASRHLAGQDSLHSIVQMPAGVPVATFAIGEAGATNAALFAVACSPPTKRSPRHCSTTAATPRARRARCSAPARERGTRRSTSTTAPPATIGMMGGGQLGRCTLIAARTMGYGTLVLDPTRRHRPERWPMRT